MTNHVDPQQAMKMASDIVIAYLGNRSVEPEELPLLVRQVRAALAADLDPEAIGATPAVAPIPIEPDKSIGPAEAKAPRPAVPIDQSITPDFLISLEDGRQFRSLKRHLMSSYGMTPDEYRAKWGLPADYPMVAPSYARDRSEVAKRIGLGGSKAPTPNPRPTVRGKRSSARR
jgi:predicted transcriptional regulator